MLEIEERVNHLDELMAQLIRTVDQTSREMRESHERSEREIQMFKAEIREFHERSKQEMRESHERSKQEMREFHERSEQEMREFHERSEREMRESHERSGREMQEFKAEMRQSKRDLDKKWGELSNKLGTMAEDLVAPNIPRILKQIADCTSEIEYSAVRVRKRKPSNQEFDVIAVCENYVLVNETKSTLRSEHIKDFYELMQSIRDYFPEFEDKQFIGAIASLYVDETLVNYGERLGLIVLGFGEELMAVLNSSNFKPTFF